MASLNKVTLIGNLGADPVKREANGITVASFSVATTETWKDKTTGEKKEATEWHRISAFGKLAEIMLQYLKKGSQVYIEGKLKTSKYQKDGVDHYSTDIVADEMKMLGGKPSGDGSQGSSAQQASAPQGAYAPQNTIVDDNIPF